MPDPARIAQAQVLEIPVTIQGEKTVDETGRREAFAESPQTTLTFDNGAVLKLQARVKAGESVSLRNEKSGKEKSSARCWRRRRKVSWATRTGNSWKRSPTFGKATRNKPRGLEKKPEAGAATSGAGSVAEKREPAGEKQELAQPEAIAAQPEAPAPAEAEAAADNSLAMMGATASN